MAGAITPYERIRNAYAELRPVLWSPEETSLVVSESLTSNTFIGSEKSVSIMAGDKVQLDTVGMLAAPSISAIAQKEILLGVTGAEPLPSQLMFGKILSLAAPHIVVGKAEFKITELTTKASIATRKITFVRTSEEQSPIERLFRESLLFEDTQIEVVNTYDCE